MSLDTQFDRIIGGLGGFYRTWFAYLGLELGFFIRLRDAGDDGLAPADLATRTGTSAEVVEVWAWGADAHGLVEFEADRLRVDPDLAAVLLDDRLPEFLGGQVVHAVTASMDWDRMADFFRTGVALRDRPERYRLAIERLTVQDVAVFFQEVLAALPQLVVDLGRGGRVLDVHCGAGRWLIAMARRFPDLELVGVESQPDSVVRARRHVEEAGLVRRISIEEGDVGSLGRLGFFDLAYFQYALHELSDAPRVLRSAWSQLRPRGRIVVLDWPLPSTQEEFRTRHGELIAGVQLDELLQGTRLETAETFVGWFAKAGLPAPSRIDLPSGATAFVVDRER